MATLLPNATQQFLDQNGVPLAGGSVYFYVPGTTTPKDTYQDVAAQTLNTNPVTLDSSGEAIIYGTGSYRQVVYDVAGNLIWDQLTTDTAVGGLAWGGTSTGTPNAQVIAASSFSQQDGQQISFIVGDGLTNTGPTTVAPGGGAGISLLKDTLDGPVSLSGGELVAGNDVSLIYNAARGAFQIVSYPIDTTPADNSITNAMLAKAPADSFKGNNTGDLADVVDMTAAQAAAILPAFTGDAGSGGVKGSVPAPASGDAAAGKILGAGGAWVSAPIGVNQTWKNPGRAIGTVYQNTSGRPIQVVVSVALASGQSTDLAISSDGTSFANISQAAAGGGAATQAPLSAIIPNGIYYKVTGGTLAVWAELS